MDSAHKAAVLNRLKSAEGHVGGIIRMTKEDAYCIDLLHQILAVQRALDKVAGLILENHLETCATTAIRGEDPGERERVLDEIVGVFQAGRR